ncbi:MAG: hypothetical protein FWH26_05395 [Oscillospiraceae bacterium]|nr:hypothetical protein [Oscillospiraceae bacterium]
MKKPICLILSVCLLASAFLLPAAAEPHPDYVANITQQPPKTLFVVHGDEIKLEIAAEAPVESDGTPLRYQWQRKSNLVNLPGENPVPGGLPYEDIEGAREATLSLSTAEEQAYTAGALYYRCKVTTGLKDGEESVATSRTCQVFVYYDLQGALAELRRTWSSARESFGPFTALAHAVNRSLNLALTPFFFVWDWLWYQCQQRTALYD